VDKSIVHAVLGCALALSAAPAVHADITGNATAPAYTAAGVVHAATQLSQTLAPNTIATLYGANLSYDTHALTAADLTGGTLPTTMAGVTVSVNGILAGLFYVSPGQINFLIPYTITTSTAAIFIFRDGTTGPTVTVPLAATAPAFFQWNGNLALAVHASGQLISPDSPATAGEIIILFAAGLGRTQPDIQSGEVTIRATPILALAQLQILLNGTPIPPANVYYAGLAPGFSGLYQLNILLPAWLPATPQIQLQIGPAVSPAGVELPSQ
jgi:uncharacterized protein (TIGR03437 family)